MVEVFVKSIDVFKVGEVIVEFFLLINNERIMILLLVIRKFEIKN